MNRLINLINKKLLCLPSFLFEYPSLLTDVICLRYKKERHKFKLTKNKMKIFQIIKHKLIITTK